MCTPAPHQSKGLEKKRRELCIYEEKKTKDERCFSFLSAHCTLYNVQCTVYRVQYRVLYTALIE